MFCFYFELWGIGEHHFPEAGSAIDFFFAVAFLGAVIAGTMSLIGFVFDGDVLLAAAM